MFYKKDRVDRFRISVLLSFFVVFTVLCGFSYAFEWRKLKGEHFVVYFTEEGKLAKEVLRKAEKYYRRIAKDLGYARYSDFWTWDNRVKIYIYPDKKSFIKATGQPEWSEGMADYREKRIISYAWSQGFIDSLLPHEMAHLIFRDFVGFKGDVPLWLDEGVAQWAEAPKRKHMRSAVRNLLNSNSLLSLEDLMKLDIRQIEGKDEIHTYTVLTKSGDKEILILSSETLVNIFYLQSFSLVGFMIKRFGTEKFTDFCRQLRDGKSIDEALRFTYPIYMRDIKELENKWRRYIEEVY